MAEKKERKRPLFVSFRVRGSASAVLARLREAFPETPWVMVRPDGQPFASYNARDEKRAVDTVAPEGV